MKNWETIYNLSPGYLFSFSDDGLITRMNAALLSDLGYSHNEVVNALKIEHLLTSGSGIFFQTHLFPLIKMQGSAKELFLIFKGKKDIRLPVLLNVLIEKEDKSFEVHCSGMEISNRNQFERELNEAKNIAERALLENKDLIRLKKELELNQHLLEKQLQKITRFNYEHFQISKVLSHDLQEPLRKIVLFISVIDNELAHDNPSYPYFVKIKRFATRIRSLINSMQRFNSLDYKELESSEAKLNIILSVAKNNSGCNDIKMTYNGQDNFILKGDIELLTNLFEELFNNSLKFKQPDKSPEITVTADQVLNNIFRHTENRYKYENFLRIKFSDNGIGFDNIYSKKVFELFRKLHTNDGLGIGLAYCKKIIDMHHGSIAINSIENVGTTFTILIPMKPEYQTTTNLAQKV